MHINEELSIKAMTVNQIYSLFVSKKLIVNRKYQRKLCWTIEEKRNFIDTISNGYPVPLFLLAINEVGDYEIIDGMQRLDAICSLIEQKYELIDGYFNLQTMPDTIELMRTNKLKQKKEVLSSVKCKEIANYPLPVSVFSSKDNSIEEVFKRINSTGKHLSPQELRQVGVNTDFANMVRHLSSEIRGDYSEDVLLLNDMSNISLSNHRLKYSINVNDIFWIKNEIINANDLRQSRDEEIVAFILASIILKNKKIYSSGNVLNRYYGYTRNPLSTDNPIEMTELQNGIDRVGQEKIINQFRKVFSCIKDLIAFLNVPFRKIVNANRSISDLAVHFQIVFMAIFRIMIDEGKTVFAVSELAEKLNGKCTPLYNISPRFQTNFSDQIDMIYGLIITAFMVDKNEDPAIDDWSMKCINILNKSRTEQVLYDFKIGLVDYQNNKLNKDVIEKIIKTLSAINNVGSNRAGYIIIGIADNEEDAKKYSAFYGDQYKLEGDFPIVGVEHDAKAIGQTIDRYTHSVKEYIKNSQSISNQYITHLLTNMKTPMLYGRQLIIFKTEFNQPVSYNNKFYIREFTDVAELEVSQYAGMFSNFYINSSERV